ncbi:response regulator [Azospira restricta]|uniref:Response regulator n=1 Tax=Azospira restricta TaxID=404405 RepID=A0A974SMJ4_9RHOO|nr:response regulator [Azospira restricta]QRJ62289.1 response regulator [Azospira restricta]
MTRCVLVVEDSPANMKLACLLLGKAGYRVLQADNAGDAIVLARAQQPDLVLMDIQLPGMDGLTATRILKSDAATRRIKVVALTAFAMKGDEERMLASGCDGYIAKPIEHRNFLAEVARVLALPCAHRETPQ